MVSIHVMMVCNGAVATSSSVCLNLLLGFLVLKHTPIQMKGYSRLMLMHCITDVIYDLVSFAVGPLVFSMGDVSLMVIQGLFSGVDGYTTDLLFTISTWIGLTSVLLIPIDFVYRYLSVCYNHELSTRSICTMAFLAYFTLWFYSWPIKAISMISLYGPSESTTNYTEMLKNIPDFAVNVPTYTFSIPDPSKPYILSTLYIAGILIFTILVIIYTSISISWTIRRKAGVANNKRAIKINKQVTKILILQAGLPLIVMIGPIVAIIVCSILKISAPLLGVYAALITMWFSSLKPFMTILIIEKYRKHVFGWIRPNVTSRSETTNHISSIKVDSKNKPARVSY